MTRKINFRNNLYMANAAVFNNIFKLFFCIIALVFVIAEALNIKMRAFSYRAFYRKKRKALAFDSEALVIGKMKMKFIEF